MPTGIQLQSLITDVRAEAGLSLNDAHGQAQRESLARRLARKQTTLWMAHDWPLHSHYWDVTFSAGDRYINYPSEVDQTRVNAIATRWADRWMQLLYGIGPQHLNEYDSDADERNVPQRRWQHYYQTGLSAGQLGQIEIWPVALESGTLRVWGHEKLNPLVADTDLCTLDSDMLILYVAGELLLRSDKADAEIKLQEANALRLRILGQSQQRQNMAIYGRPSRAPRLREGIDYVTKRSGT